MMQQGGNNELMQIGSRLSEILQCPCRYPAYSKNLFACIKHDFIIPVYKLRGSEDWGWVKQEHDEYIKSLTI